MATQDVLRVAAEAIAHGTEMIETLSISCNDTCCKYSDDDIICFSEYNYTDINNLTTWAPWELGVRWSFASLVMLVAVLENLSIIIILAKNRLLLRTSVNLFILNMSVADLALALAGPIPFTIRDTSNFWPLGETWCHLEGYIQMLVMLVSVTSLATISCDRMIGVVRPFHTHLKKWQAVATIVVIWVLCAMLAVPWAIYRVFTVHKWNDRTQTICGESDKIHIWWIVAVLGLTWLPFTIMLVSYTTILVYFRRPKFKNLIRNEHPVITHLKQRVVKMMFLVALLFVVCWLPFQILKIFYKSFLDDFGQFKDDATMKRYNILLTLSQYMIFVNPAVNPIVYGLLHQTFRRALRLTFPCIFRRKSSLVLTRGQGLSRYMWSVKSSGSKLSNSNTQRRHSVKEQIYTNSTATQKVPSRFKTLSDEKDPFLKCKSAMKKGKHFCHNKHFHLDGQNCNKKKSWSSDGEDNGHSSYVNEGTVTDLPLRKVSMLSECALDHLITQVIEEETSSDMERERIL